MTDSKALPFPHYVAEDFVHAIGNKAKKKPRNIKEHGVWKIIGTRKHIALKKNIKTGQFLLLTFGGAHTQQTFISGTQEKGLVVREICEMMGYKPRKRKKGGWDIHVGKKG